MVYSAKSDAVGTISQFTRRKAIKITTSGTSTPTNYQIKVTIVYETVMNVNFNDIRFNSKNGVYIDYWIESYTASTTATVWLELPDAITDPGSDSIWMYYGNAAVSDAGNGNNTFIQYQGATSTPFTLSPVATNIVVRFSFDPTGTDYIGATANAPFGGDMIYWEVVNGSTASKPTVYNNNVYTQNTKTITLPTTDIYDFYLVSATSCKYYQNGNLIDTITTYVPDANLGLFLYTGGNVNYAFMRKYITIEPTATLGTAQHQRRVATFL